MSGLGRMAPLLVAVVLLAGGLASVLANAIAGDPPAPATTAAGREAEEGGGSAAGSASSPRRRDTADNGEGEGEAYLAAPAPGEASAAGADPEAVAARFGELWVNRSGELGVLKARRVELVSLSRGAWARQLEVEYEAAQSRGADPNGSEGSVVETVVAPAEGSGDSRGYLVVCRERLLFGGKPLEPYRYATYLARMTNRDGGWAVTSWEPQI